MVFVMAVDRRKCCQLNAAVGSLSHFVYNLLSATQRRAVRRRQVRLVMLKRRYFDLLL